MGVNEEVTEKRRKKRSKAADEGNRNKNSRHAKDKKLRKQQKSKNEDDSYNVDGLDDDHEGDEELIRTPPSSHHPSEDEGADDQYIEDDDRVAKKATGRAKARKPAATKKSAPAKRTRADEAADGEVNTVKTRNRLVGKIVNNDIYCEDDDYPRRENEEMVHEEDYEGQALDLGLGDKSNAPKKQFNFMNKAAVDASDLNAKIKQLGFTRDTNVNELAARGVNLSLRDEIIRKLQHDKKQAQEQAPKEGTVQAPADGAGQADESKENA